MQLKFRRVTAITTTLICAVLLSGCGNDVDCDSTYAKNAAIKMIVPVDPPPYGYNGGTLEDIATKTELLKRFEAADQEYLKTHSQNELGMNSLKVHEGAIELRKKVIAAGKSTLSWIRPISLDEKLKKVECKAQLDFRTDWGSSQKEVKYKIEDTSSGPLVTLIK